MYNLKFNFAAVISIIVLLLYSYIVFLGVVYWNGGNIWKGLLCVALLIAVVLACVYVMCKSRATRWQKIGNTGQIIFGGVILAALAVSSMPFAHFLKLVNNQKQVTAAFETSHSYATGLNKAYKDYVEKRKHETRDFLNDVSANRTGDYQTIFGLPGSDDNNSKIERMITNLEKTLLPAVLRRQSEQDAQRLQKAAKMSVWSVAMPGYVNRIDETVRKNIDTYANISKKAHGYKGDYDPQPFTYAEYVGQNAKFKQMLSSMSMPSVLSVLAALVCFAFMLLPYFLTERDLAASVSKKKSGAEGQQPTAPLSGKMKRSRLNEHKQRKSS